MLPFSWGFSFDYSVYDLVFIVETVAMTLFFYSGYNSSYIFIYFYFGDTNLKKSKKLEIRN